MDGHTDDGARGRQPDAVDAASVSPGIGMSRRDFTTKFGLGSAAAVGLAVGAPNIRTIAFATKAKAGSPAPRGTTTTTSSVPGRGHGSITVSDPAPCAGDSLRVQAHGFVPHTAVALELDSPEFTLGNTTADSVGAIDVQIDVTDAMAGSHRIVASGIQQGGRSLDLSIHVNIKTRAECRQEPQGSTTPSSTTIASAESSTSPTTGPPTSSPQGGGHGGHGQAIGGEHVAEGNGLAFTGTDAIDLALIGAAATVGGRLLYGLARPADDEEDED